MSMPRMNTAKTTLLLACSLTLLAGCEQGEEGQAQDSGLGVLQPGSADSAGTGEMPASCEELPDQEELTRLLREAPEQGEAGGLFSGRREWAAVVNRQGELCAVAVSTEDPAATWPGSLPIAKAKAYTANAFSTDLMPMSTARLYTMSQPGRTLYGAANGNPFDPACLASPEQPLEQAGRICGGTITFGGGLALYRDSTRIGGLGLSGDTPCADHEIAKRMRTAAQLNPPQGQGVDDIQYGEVDEPSVYIHPLCPNTWRNGESIGEAPKVQGYGETPAP